MYLIGIIVGEAEFFSILLPYIYTIAINLLDSFVAGYHKDTTIFIDLA